MQHKKQTIYLPSSRPPGFLSSGTARGQAAAPSGTHTEQGAAQSVTGAGAARAQLSPHTGMPAASWETPLGHHPSCPGSNSWTHRTLALTPAGLWFMWGSCSKASRAPLPARRHQSQAQHPHQGPVQPTENHREDGSTALLRVQPSQIREI